ncbi:MAG: RidA family protein [Deltaproteobacteria bacterium]|nr:RidA family protein [Deltaproteobacteria bacterium]
MPLEIVNPSSLPAPRGWSHGVLGPPGGRALFIAGMSGIGGAADGKLPPLVEQFGSCLDQTLEVLRAAGAAPTDVARMTVYVTDLAAYRANLKALGAAWRERFGKHYPAMALVEVKGLVDPNALVEIETTAVVPGER